MLLVLGLQRAREEALLADFGRLRGTGSRAALPVLGGAGHANVPDRLRLLRTVGARHIGREALLERGAQAGAGRGRRGDVARRRTRRREQTGAMLDKQGMHDLPQRDQLSNAIALELHNNHTMTV